ncbi:MAG: glycoside hydrolase family 3 C-terminal domain-containing protein [Trebonia sp.]
MIQARRWWPRAAALLMVAGTVSGAAGGSAEAASASAGTAGVSTAKQATASISQAAAVRQAESLVAKMTLTQKITELHGLQDASHLRYVPGIPSLGIPPLVTTNGPAGPALGDDPAQQPATAMPAPISLAASFDPSLARQYGQVIGQETADLGENLIEGPDVNIVRVPLAGRTFESFTEDPYLDGQIGASEIQGIQRQPGMIAQVKHFDAYNQETSRNTPADDDIVSDRTLHEIYMPAFEQSVTKGGVASVMCSYASINGTYSCEDPYILKDTLDQRWGFTGFTMSDFTATHSTVASAQAGLDLEMPTGDYYDAQMQQAIQLGEVPVSTVDQMLVSRFAAMIRQGLFSHPAATRPIPASADGAFSRDASEQGMVLLKNSASQLPLSASAVKSVAVIGPYGGSAMTGGGGSSHVNPLYTVSPIQGIHNVAGPSVAVTYDDGSDLTSAVAAAKAADVAVVMVGDTESEGTDQSSLSLSGNQDQLVEAVAAANPHTIVVVKSGNPVLMPWLGQVPAVLEAWYPGEEDGNAVAAVLFGQVNPSGHLPVTFPASESQTPVSSPSQFPGVNGQVDYSEGLGVGYRWYDASDVTPLFPFGYGLSYTTFRYSDLRVTRETVDNASSGDQPESCGCNGQSAKLDTVTATVTNTGDRAGADVAQLYLGDPAAAGEPPRQLKGFDKVYLRPGQSATVRFSLTGHDLSYWDQAANGWIVPDGTFQVYVGDSSALAGLPLRGQFAVDRSAGAQYATLSAPATVNPGDSFTATATYVNDGDYAMSGDGDTIVVPGNWEVQPAGTLPHTISPHQTVAVAYHVTVPESAQATSPALTARLGKITAQATVSVAPAVAATATTAVLTSGGSAPVTLSLANHLGRAVSVSYTASPDAGITITPAAGTLTVPPGGTTVTLQAAAAENVAPSAYPVPLALTFTDQGYSAALPTGVVPVTVAYPALSASFDNAAVSDDSDTSTASLDGNDDSISAQALAALGVTPGAPLTYDGVSFTWPSAAPGQPDNTVTAGQTISLSGSGTTLGLLDTGTFGPADGTGTITYSDGITQPFTVSVPDWYRTAPAGSNPVIVLPYRNTPPNHHGGNATGQDYTPNNVYEQSIPLRAGKQVVAITLPTISSAAIAGSPGLHVFAIGFGS